MFTKQPIDIRITCDDPSLAETAQCYARSLNLEVNAATEAEYTLHFGLQGAVLTPQNKHSHGPVQVDLTAGKNAHRRQFGGGKSQLIAKACGIKNQKRPSVLDTTAGLGADAFVLASLGCDVTMLERSPVAHALLSDGIKRAHLYAQEQDPELLETLQRMHLKLLDSINYLQLCTKPAADVIYLDPMFPEKTKSAKVNKNMQAFHVLVGPDDDVTSLLQTALQSAGFRVVVKRPRLAPAVQGDRPTYSLEGKSSRYDIYVIKSLDKASPDSQ